MSNPSFPIQQNITTIAQSKKRKQGLEHSVLTGQIPALLASYPGGNINKSPSLICPLLVKELEV